jgi:putative ATPase
VSPSNRDNRDADLFSHAAAKRSAADAPLAERMRPKSVDEIAGQQEIVGGDGFLGRILRGETTPRSAILWGPPGTGKTTIARLMAAHADYELVSFSAVLSGVKELRGLIAEAEQRRNLHGRNTILFVDEIHRFNKSQQDAFLPHVEAGTIVLVGATTENPSFEINAPLLSRCRVVVLQSLDSDEIAKLLDRAVADAERGLAGRVQLSEDARVFLSERADGDARAALGGLEAAADLVLSQGASEITLELAEQGLQKRALRYDRDGEEHYNVISAFIKSMRGSDVDAALYWLARMIEAGEDALFIARRIVIFASEDVGLADAQALPLAVAARDAVHFIGMPEGRIPLAHAVAYLAGAPKSNASYTAINAALEEVRSSGALPVPLHLRNAPTKLMRNLGYGQNYAYAHDDPGGAQQQQHLPDALRGKRFFTDK